jgi:hypothetical protein
MAAAFSLYRTFGGQPGIPRDKPEIFPRPNEGRGRGGQLIDKHFSLLLTNG